MALLIHWYDFVCFATVVGAIICSVLMISESECSGRRVHRAKYESLLITELPMEEGLREESMSLYLGFDQLWTSCWQGLHPAWLFATRCLSLVAMLGILAWDIRTFGWSDFIYYTEWTFTLVIIYFAIATLISAYGCWNYSKQGTRSNEVNKFIRNCIEQNCPATLTFGTNRNGDAVKHQNHHKKEMNDRKAGFWGYVMQIIYQSSAGAVVLTDLVFWCIIAPFLPIVHFRLNTVMGCMHSLNAVFLLLDTALNNLPFPWFRIAYFVLWSCIYVIFQWVLHACGFSWWPYPFLLLSSSWAPLWYFCLAFFHIPCYSLYLLMVKAKNSVLQSCFSMPI